MKPFLLPPTLLALAWAVGIVCVRHPNRRRLGVRVCIGALIVYVLLATEPLAYALTWSLERQYASPSAFAEIPTPTAIVILAGGADEAEGRRDVPELGGASWRRLWRGIAVYHELDGLVPVIYSGGSGDPFRVESHEAELAQSYAIAIGIPSAQFLVEGKSRDTYENGVEVRRILEARAPKSAPYRIILVTSARHMPRAIRVFTRIGIHAIPAPADVAVRGFRWSPLQILPTAEAFASSTASIREWVGMIGYRMRGRI